MDIIFTRIEALERSVYSNAQDTVHSENIVGQVALVERQLNKTLSENRTLALGLEKYEKLRDIIDGDGDIELSRSLLGVNAKTELILLNDGALNTLSDMRIIADLQSKVNQPEYAAAAEQLSKSQQLERRHRDQAAVFRQAVADISLVIDKYHAETEVLSEMFVEWDRILTTIERKVSELETTA
ncbi:hypothetical protein GGI25_001251 [Coemansia spiralis]|uniref:Uncharacterized protein n=2 Tax=Coemansia TaxID=4863 RepID=A0A9W8GB53_9FUNG|nr:hypothetical protein BX070DRAFT_232984 [Coemansia spiralis]KAJ1994948.1 hypothetical protein EDC05_001324 [Coemansia umbellata]KAJ2624614.1 hypothetical protein GGI26_001307 [Coemansia sp. RSA 1358]KAJ2679799.1 hypothetical protein GGI25_001251 [Coemansia spiralis]